MKILPTVRMELELKFAGFDLEQRRSYLSAILGPPVSGPWRVSAAGTDIGEYTKDHFYSTPTFAVYKPKTIEQAYDASKFNEIASKYCIVKQTQ